MPSEAASIAATRAFPQTRSLITEMFWSSPTEARFDQGVIAPVTGYSESWLEKARTIGGGPAFIRVGGTEAKDKNGKTRVFGGRVFYRKADVVEWLKLQTPVRNTSEYRATCGGSARAAPMQPRKRVATEGT